MFDKLRRMGFYVCLFYLRGFIGETEVSFIVTLKYVYSRVVHPKYECGLGMEVIFSYERLLQD